jgi:diphosphoinositol-polyphosphate diphosphatase
VNLPAFQLNQRSRRESIFRSFIQYSTNNTMSYSKVKTFRRCSPSSDHPTTKQTLPNSTIVNTDSMKIDPFKRKSSDGNVSDASTFSLMGKLEAPGRLTPTCPGRMKAPPICRDRGLKRVASTVSVIKRLFDELFVCANSSFTNPSSQIQDIQCFSPQEAEKCAEKCARMAGESDVNVEEIPFNVEGDFNPPEKPEGKPHVSSSSTVVTNTSVSVGGIAAQALTPVSVKKDPPLKVVRTDDNVVNSEDETGVAAEDRGENTNKTVPSPPSSPKQLPPSFTDKLIKDAQSRQGRSLQRWLLHSQTESLVREVAGCIPITRDGRIVLVSASRKNEWILPKGGWDSDETKEECAVRETYEEGGLLGKLGSCLAPIDYESGKSKKRRLEASIKSTGEGIPPSAKKARRELKDGSEPKSDISPENGQESKLSFIRLLLFPLYLTEVKSDWPEKGRLRKLVDIDEAIKIMEQEDRLYFKKGLEMVKDMGLHLLHQH